MHTKHSLEAACYNLKQEMLWGSSKNAKNRFRALSKGAGAGQQLGSILSKLKAGADNEAKEDKKKVVINIFQSKNRCTLLEVFL